jgi:hypothetical protein
VGVLGVTFGPLLAIRARAFLQNWLPLLGNNNFQNQATRVRGKIPHDSPEFSGRKKGEVDFTVN